MPLQRDEHKYSVEGHDTEKRPIASIRREAEANREWIASSVLRGPEF